MPPKVNRAANKVGVQPQRMDAIFNPTEVLKKLRRHPRICKPLTGKVSQCPGSKFAIDVAEVDKATLFNTK